MKKGKRLALILIAALAMLIAFSVTAFAADSGAYPKNVVSHSTVMWDNGVTSNDGLTFKVWNLKADAEGYAKIPVAIVAPNTINEEKRYVPLIKWDDGDWEAFYTRYLDSRPANVTWLLVNEEMIRDAIKNDEGIISHTCQCDWTGDKVTNNTFDVTIDVTDAELYDENGNLIVEAKKGEIVSHDWAYADAKKTNEIELYCQDELCEYAKGNGFVYKLEMEDEYTYLDNITWKFTNPEEETGFPPEYRHSGIKYYVGKASSASQIDSMTRVENPNAVGEYTASIKLLKDSTHQTQLYTTFEIIPDVEVTPAEGVKYGSNQQLVLLDRLNPDDCVVTYSLDVDEDGKYSETVPTADAGVDAGKHTVFFKVTKGDYVYQDSVKVKISRQPVTVEWGEGPFSYVETGGPLGPDPEIKGEVGEESLVPVFRTKYPNKQIEAGQYTAWIKDFEAADEAEEVTNPKNYVFDKEAELAHGFKITRPLNVELSMDDFTYGGEDIQAPVITGKDADLVNEDTEGRFEVYWHYRPAGSEDFYDYTDLNGLMEEIASEDVFEKGYTVQAKIIDTKGVYVKSINSTIAATPYTKVYISPAELTINVYNRYEYYGYRVQAEESSGYELEGLVNDDTEEEVLGSISFAIKDGEESIEPGTKLGLTSYDIVAEAEKEPVNYNLVKENGFLTIVELTDNHVAFKSINKTFTYGDKVGRPVATATYCTDEEPIIKYALATSDTTKEDSWKTWPADELDHSTKISAGTYIVMAEVKQNTGYAGGFAFDEFTVEKRAATIDLSKPHKEHVYDGVEITPTKKNTGVKVEGTVNGDELQYKIVSDPSPIKNVGTYVLDASFDPDSGVNANYNITVVKGSFTITKKAATINLNVEHPAVEYDGTTYEPEKTEAWVTVGGLVEGEDLVYDIFSEPSPMKNAGTYELKASFDPDSGANANYEITVEEGSFTIDKKPLTVTAANKEKTYGDRENYRNPVLGEDYTADGLVKGEENNLRVVLSRQTTSPSDYYVGDEHPINIRVTGNADILNNYVITPVSGTLTINPATLTVTAENQTKTYGDDDPDLTYKATGFKYRDTAATELTGSLARTTGESGESVGDHAITQGTLDVVGHGEKEVKNYTIAFTDAILSITPATLTITAKDQTITAGDDFNKNSVEYSGWKRGEDASALTKLPTVTSDYVKGTSTAGSYYLRPEGAVAANYTFDYVDGTLTVNSPTPTPPGPSPEPTPTHDPVADLINMINNLPAPDAVTTNDKAAIDAAQAAYDALTPGQKTDPRLTPALLNKLNDCEAALEQAEKDQKAADEVSALIDKLPADPAQADPEVAKATLAAYWALTDAQRALLSDSAKQTVAVYKYFYEKQYAKAKKAKLKSVKAKKNQKAKAKWEKVSAVNGYQLYYKAKGTKAKKVNINKPSTVKKTVKKLKAGKVYTFKVRTFTTIDNPYTGEKEKVYGKWSNKKKIKAKK